MTQTVNVRIATRDDIDSIVEFQLTMAWETESLVLSGETVGRGVAGVFEAEGRGLYYVAEVDGKVVASLLTTYEWSDWRNGTILWIQSVFVKPEFRRRGIYSAMYHFLREKVTDDDAIKGIRLYVDKTNHNAYKTYSSLGMNGEHYLTFEWMKP